VKAFLAATVFFTFVVILALVAWLVPSRAARALGRGDGE